MASFGRQQQLRHRRPLRTALLALAATALALALLAAPAAAEVVYDNPPAAGAPAAIGFAETGTAELGSLVRFAGAARVDPQVHVRVVADACGEGSTEPGCATPGATFELPVTASVYAANADGSPGALVARQTESYPLAYEGVQTLDFDLYEVTLPPEAIVTVAFSTAASGYWPTGVAGPADTVSVALAGPPATGAAPREAEGVYRAAAEPGAAPVLGFEAEPTTWEGRQPAFTVEATAAAAPTPAPAAVAPTAAATSSPAVRRPHREYAVPPSKRMTVSFPRPIARIAGPGALVQVRCTGSSAARCIGTLALIAGGSVHKAPFSISKGRRQYVVVPLGDDLPRLEGPGPARAIATASTIQVGGAAVSTKRALKLK